ncbi:hypothetical protein FM103_19870 [Corynebacterium xerosis]|nr:hypothetical protein FM103_19870 [Corynebacterium xerosis]
MPCCRERDDAAPSLIVPAPSPLVPSALVRSALVRSALVPSGLASEVAALSTR